MGFVIITGWVGGWVRKRGKKAEKGKRKRVGFICPRFSSEWNGGVGLLVEKKVVMYWV